MKVVFQMESAAPVTLECAAGDNLLELARRGNVDVDAVCAGSGACGQCRVRLVEGRLESRKSRHISGEDYENGWRLACQSRVVEDCTVFVPERAGIGRTDLTPGELFWLHRAMESLREQGIGFSHPFCALHLLLPPPSPEDTMPDNERLSRAIRERTGAERVDIPYSVMAGLSHTLREQNFNLWLKGCLEKDTFFCMDVCGEDRLLGAAIDLGTTTVAAALWDLSTGRLLAGGSTGNRQSRYGADVISRIIAQGRPGGRNALQAAIVEETLNPLLEELCREVGAEPSAIVRLCVGANTTMNHLLVGADAQSVRTEPYVPSFFSWDGLRAGDLGLKANPQAAVCLAPNVGAYVGGDITAGVLAAGLWNTDKMCLLIDLGTNGEIVFGNREFLVSCACSAGPAFEGGGISCGMRAAEGAIQGVSLRGQTPECVVIGGPDQRPAGICGSGLIDILAELYRYGVINSRGTLVGEGSRILRDADGMGRFILAFPEESATGREISITEGDMDSFIRAKGAVFAAIETALASVDMPVEAIDRVYVAGGMGTGIHVENGIRIGLFPNLPPERFQYIGNACLAGAGAMVLSDEAQALCARAAANMTYLELSREPGYMERFVAACFIPHTDRAKFPGRDSGTKW